MGNSNETATSPSKQLSSSQSPPVPARNAPAGAPDCAYYVKINHPPTLSGWPAPPDGDKQELAVAVAEPVYPTNAEPGAGKKQEQAAAAECCPRVPDCVYYVKFGRCKLGMNCKFNHPRKQCECPAPAAAPKQQEAAAEYARHCNEVLDCFYYVKMGSCKNGINCKFNHPPGKLLGKRSGGGVNSGISDEASTTEYNVVPRSNVPVAAEISPATNKHKETQKVVSSSPSSKKSGKRKRIEGYGLLVCESSGTTFFQRGTKRKILSWPKDRSTARASAQAGGSGHATVHLQNNAKNSGPAKAIT